MFIRGIIEPDDSPTLLEHHARALANKFLPCTASMFATAVGFAALAISDIRPVREMGLWTACGLIVAWIGCFTLFPALQSLLRTPMRSEKALRSANGFPASSTRWFRRAAAIRWPLVGGALLLMLCGAAALFGIPGVLVAPRSGDGRADLRQSQRARGPGYPPLRGVERARCRRALAADAARPCSGSGFPARCWSS